MADIHSILKKYWGYEAFRPQQEAIIHSVLAGKDTLALLPTGGGKSICYQVPALAQEGICLVISPLIALMKDQVENLKKRGIGALVIYSGMNRKDVIRTLENARQEYFKFLYVSPERLETALFQEYLPALHINLIAVDEAHCISQWGYDFRPSYLKIAALREELPNVPVLAVTASATERVQQDICEKLAPLPPKGGVANTQPSHKQDANDLLAKNEFEYITADPISYRLLKQFVKEHRSNSTQAEDILWYELRGKQLDRFKFRRQHIIGNYIADFVCLSEKLIIEVDGLIHQLLENKASDEERTLWLNMKGYQVIRFANEEVINHIDKVLSTILHALRKKNNKDGSPTSEGCVLATPPLGGRGAGWSIFRQPFERKNLSYSVFKVDAKPTKLVEILQKVQGTAIVYCKSRKRTVEVSSLLQMHGLLANFYHAGLQTDERPKRQQDWIDNKTRIIVCTNAFGMGIDKPDVRTVVHIDAPDCLENYYQEAGRCGRDGKKAYAILLYNEKDVEDLEQLHLSRYPSFEVIQSVYEALMNYLQVPANTGQDNSYNFRFDDFIRNFKLNVHQALYAVQAMESDGWMEYNEKNFTPSTLVFTTSKEGLYEFYKAHPENETLLTTLLRTYGGIFDFPVFISEPLMAKLLRDDEKKIKEQLQKVAAYSIIRYTPQNDEPQIVLLKNRVAVQDFNINLQQYNQRKQLFIERVKTMVHYLQMNGCRSRFIGHYFGDATAGNCGVCDSCLAKNRTDFTTEEFTSIASLIQQQLMQKSFTAEQLVNELGSIKKEKTWQVLQFLQAEKKITANSEGILQNKE